METAVSLEYRLRGRLGTSGYSGTEDSICLARAMSKAMSSGKAAAQDGEIGELCYIDLMSPKVKEILQHVASWPEEDQEELAEVARDIEARRTGMYRLSEEERHAIQKSLAEVRAGRFASDAEIDAIFAKARAARRRRFADNDELVILNIRHAARRWPWEEAR